MEQLPRRGAKDVTKQRKQAKTRGKEAENRRGGIVPRGTVVPPDAGEVPLLDCFPFKKGFFETCSGWLGFLSVNF